MRNKIDSYLGFAKRSRNLVTGYNTCLAGLKSRKIRLLILAEDVAENTTKKFTDQTKYHNIPLRFYGTKDELSQLTGEVDKGVFGITDSHFAQIICKELDSEMK